MLHLENDRKCLNVKQERKKNTPVALRLNKKKNTHKNSTKGFSQVQ